jgi:hypothetical protein
VTVDEFVAMCNALPPSREEYFDGVEMVYKYDVPTSIVHAYEELTAAMPQAALSEFFGTLIAQTARGQMHAVNSALAKRSALFLRQMRERADWKATQ